MDNFPGLFQDGDLGNLELDAESFTPQAPASLPVQEMDMSNFNQSSFPNIGNPGNPRTNSSPSGMGVQGTPQKMTHGAHASPGHTTMNNYASQNIQYSTGAPNQQVVGQYNANQFRQQYQGQNMYGQQPNPNMGDWNNASAPYTQVAGSYQQPQSQYPQQAMNSFQNQQTINTANFQATHHNMAQNYPAGSQGMAYQATNQPQFPGYEQQRPLGANSHINYNKANPMTNQSSQQYNVMQTPNQQYISQYSQNQVHLRPQHPSQIPPQTMVRGSGSQGELSLPSSPIPNGTAYRTPFPQVSPQMPNHAQGSPIPQSSPMPRSISPHTHSNTNLMNSPISSPASHPMSASISPNNSSVGSIQQLENMVKPNGTGVNVHMNSPNNISQTHSSNLYGNPVNIHGVVGQRGPVSPSIVNQPQINSGLHSQSQNQWPQNRTPQAYMPPNNINQGIASSTQIINSIPNTREQVASVSDKTVCLSDMSSAVGLGKGQVPCNANVNKMATSNISTESVNSVNLSGVGPNSRVEMSNSNSVTLVNGTISAPESVGDCNSSPNVPLSSLSTYGTTSPGVLSGSQAVPTANTLGLPSQMIPNPSAPPGSENGLPSTSLCNDITSSDSSVKLTQNAPSVTQSGNTLTLYSASHPEGQSTVVQQSFLLMDSAILDQNAESSDQVEKSSTTVQNTKMNPADNISTSSDIAPLKNTVPTITAISNDTSLNKNVSPSQLVTSSETPNPVISNQLSESPSKVMLPSPDVQDPHSENDDSVISSSQIEKSPVQMPTQALPDSQSEAPHSPTEDAESTITPQLNLSIDITKCRNEIQQLHNAPEDSETQQKMQELETKLAQLEAQQQKQQEQFLDGYSSRPSAEVDEKKPKKRGKPRTPKEPKTPRTPKPKREPKVKEPKESKPKREPKVKTPRTPKEPKPKKERTPRTPKEPKPKTPRERKKPVGKRSRKKAVTKPVVEGSGDAVEVMVAEGGVEGALFGPDGAPLLHTPIHASKLPSSSKSSRNEKRSKARGMFAAKKKTKLLVNPRLRKKPGSESDYSESEGVSVPKVEGVEDDENKRRSGRIQQGSRKKYVDELVLNLSDDDASKKDDADVYDDPFAHGSGQSYVMVNTNEEDSMPVQMILSTRRGEREVPVEATTPANPENEYTFTDEPPKAKSKSVKKIEVDEYFVKYKGLSYLHCSWGTEDELLKGDKRISGKIKRYRQKRAASQNIMDFLEEEPYNPDYIEIDRILDVMDYSEDEKPNKHFLVKWKSLPYDESTWEMEDDCEVDKIEAFYRHQKVPSKADLKYKKRPKSDEWKELSESPVYNNNNQLRGYQLEGVNWLTFSYYNGHNCILADEMGLGKTIQSLAFVQTVFNYGIRGPYLIIAPLSTIPNWQREFEGWTDLNVIVYHGSQSSRNMILEYEMAYKDENKEKIPDVYKFNVLITTFEVIIADNTELKEIEWRICIIDEAHRLKNRNCKLLEGLRIMHLDHRVLLSGTPLQNNVNELFSLLNFLEPTQFACQETFLHEFGNLQTEEQVKKLQALLKPMMLRRMKEDVEKSLAPKQETIIEVELTNIQKKYYRAILERNFDFLIKGATYTNVPSLMNTMMELRKCCLHPYLLNGAEDGIQQDYKDLNPESPDVYHSALIQSSGKMVLVDKLLPRLKANGHRVLVFSQMVKLLDIIEDYLIYRKYPYERLDGRIRGNLRQAAIDRFCKPDSDRFVFLLCTKAGGLGINLTAADTVIIYDSDWNPQNDLQAQARCHRIGQQKSVKIYRLLCNNTYEREMFDKASLKLGLDKAVLQSMNTEVKAAAGNSLGLSKKEVEDLLKKGAYGALMEDDNQGDKFCEEDIDQILSRRATVVTLESEKGSTFSKASFSSSDNRNDIDLADPDFWKKWAKKADIDVDSADKQLIMDEPRKRSAIRRYGHDESVLDCSDLDSSGSDSVAEQEQLDDATVEPGLRRTRRRRRNKGGREGKPSRSSKSGKSGGRWGADDEPADDDEVRYGLWHRSECFKVEKGLLTFGWGRWSEIMRHGEFRSAWTDSDVLACARMVLLYCIRYYRGDDKIKGFIFDLIAPSTDGKTRMHPNHIGLSAPVPRGRKGKKKLREAKLVATHMECAEWAKDEKFDCEKHLDQGYSRHLVRHANKVLLRVRLLFYIKQEIIGDHDAQINNGSHANELPIYPPPTELLPRPWWDNEADRNLLVGVYKHGYERYNVMRNDPSLCFLQRCGPPDAEALVAEMANNANVEEDNDKAGDDSDSNQMTPSSPAPSSATNKSEDDRRDASSGVATPSGQGNASALHQFPTPSDLNGRLRRLVTSYQRNNRKLEMRKEANIRGFDHYMADKMMRRERMAEYMRDRDLRKTDYSQRRWSNREQSEFYRTISTFGVEYIRKEKRYDWSKFRMLSRLEKRLDENLTEYFRAFMAMCKRQCGIRLTEQENAKILEIGVDRLPEERARRVLERVDMLNRLRNDVLTHSEVHKALELALPSKDMPDWWIPGKHDLDLLRGVARHGMGRTDYYILYDPDLCFREILRRHTAGEPLITTEEKAELNRKYYNDAKIADEGQDSENEGVENAESKAENENTETETDKIESEEKDSADISEEAKAPEITEEESSQNSSEEIPKSEEIKMEVESKAEPTSQDANGEQKSEVKAESVKDEADVKPALEKDVKSEEDLESSVKAEREESKVETVKEEKNAQVDETEVKSEKADLKETKQEPDTQMEESNEESKKAAEPVEEESSEKADATSETKVTKAMPGLKGIPTPPLLSLQQMDEAMSKIGVSGQIDPTVLNEPTVAQLLAQSAANPIKWPKDRYLQIRLEHIMYAVEHKRWPVPLDYQTVEYDFSSGGSKCDTPPSAPSTPTGHQHHAQEIYMMEAERKRRRQIEEVERAAHLQAMLHPNLHHNLGLSKVQAALGLNANSFAPNLRTLMEASEHDKKTQQLLSDSHTHALRQLQALQGSLDLTIKPVSSQAMEIGGVQLLSRRGPGRPRLDESMLKASPTGDKRRQCDSPQDGRKRRKLDDIVLGLTSKSGKFPDLADISVRDSHTLSLLRSPSVSIITSKDRTSVTPSINTPKLSSSISITPTSLNKLAAESRKDTRSPSKHSEKESSKPGLVKSSDLPPGISLPPGIELYRPADSTKVDKWLEQHQDLLGEIKSREPKRRKVDLTSLDWSKFSGDEVVPLVNSSNGHTLSSSDCPKLKYLAQWLMEHPGYEVDPRWVESNKDILTSKVSSELHNRLTNSHDKKSTRQPSTSSGSSRSGLDAKRLQGLLDLKNPLALAALSTLDPKILAGLDPKKLAGIDPKLLAGLDPKHLLGSIDAKTLGIDPKHPAFDPKILSAMGIDPKLLGIDVSKHQETKVERKPSPAQSPCSSTKSNESKPSTSHGIDPKLLAGLDPKLLGGLDPKLLQALDPKVLGLDPKMLASLDPKALAGLDLKALGLDPKQLMGGIDPKLLSALGGGVDPKLLASLGGMDPMMMMAAGFGGLPNMAGLGLANPFLAGLSGFNLGGMPNVSTSSSSKDNQRQAAAAAALAANQANLFAGMFGGAAAAGLMYPPLGLGALNPFQLPQMSAAQSSALLNGFATPVTSVSATPRSNSSYSKRQTEKERLRQEAEREREIVAARKEKIKESMKVGMSKEDKTLKQSKAERLARVDPRTTVQSHEIFLANHLSQLGSFGQIDLSIRPVTSSSKSSKSNSERTTPVSPSKGSEEAEPSAPDPVVPTKQSEPEAEPDEQESVPEPEEKEEAEENDS